VPKLGQLRERTVDLQVWIGSLGHNCNGTGNRQDPEKILISCELQAWKVSTARLCYVWIWLRYPLITPSMNWIEPLTRALGFAGPTFWWSKSLWCYRGAYAISHVLDAIHVNLQRFQTTVPRSPRLSRSASSGACGTLCPSKIYILTVVRLSVQFWSTLPGLGSQAVHVAVCFGMTILIPNANAILGNDLSSIQYYGSL